MNSSGIESPLKKTWKRLLRNKPAIFSLSVIIIAVLLAILGPLIAPDKTPDADDQVLELANQRPGFTTNMLLVRKNRDVRETTFIQKIVKGRDNPYEMVPISSYTFSDTTIVVQAFNGEGRSAEQRAYPLVEVVYSLSTSRPQVDYGFGKATFRTFDEKLKLVEVSKLKSQIEEEQIITKKYRLGTDGYGRDILSRLLFGVRVSLSVGLVAVIISLSIGIFMGSMAGFFRGWTDNIIMWLINVVWSIPTILLAMAIRFAIGDKINSFLAIFIAVGLSMWVEVARIVRGQVLSVREMEYVQAARGLGFNNVRIIIRHILPNIIGPIMVIAASDFASAILIESGLSFIGLGVKPPTPSWGTMLNDHRAYLLSPDKAFLALAPGICIMILVLAFNLLGNGLRDAFDVKGQTV
jgi:peptide/nickel transport system permease protein